MLGRSPVRRRQGFVFISAVVALAAVMLSAAFLGQDLGPRGQRRSGPGVWVGTPLYAYDGDLAKAVVEAGITVYVRSDLQFRAARLTERRIDHPYDRHHNLARASARPDNLGSAPRAADDFVDLASPARRTHILRGDAAGGGHLWAGQAGKTPFPQSWSGDRIMHEISDIATDPAAWRGAVPQGSRTV